MTGARPFVLLVGLAPGAVDFGKIPGRDDEGSRVTAADERRMTPGDADVCDEVPLSPFAKGEAASGGPSSASDKGAP